MNNAAKAPYIKFHREGLTEFKFNNKEALGLAFVKKTAALSLNCFPDGRIELERSEILDDGQEHNDKFNSETISSTTNFKAKRLWLHEIAQRDINNGDELYANFRLFFPRLRLSEHAGKNLRLLNGHEYFFKEFLRHFSILNDTAEDWKEGIAFSTSGLDFSKESQQTLNKYRTEHTFTCYDNKQRVFSKHSKIIGANQRIYFYHDAQKGIVHIGHAGLHLPTVEYH